MIGLLIIQEILNSHIIQYVVLQEYIIKSNFMKAMNRILESMEISLIKEYCTEIIIDLLNFSECDYKAALELIILSLKNNIMEKTELVDEDYFEIKFHEILDELDIHESEGMSLLIDEIHVFFNDD